MAERIDENPEEVGQPEIIHEDPEVPVQVDADVLDQQPGPANADGLRQSERLPGQRPGTFLYGDGNGFYYRTRRIVGDKRYLRCINAGCPASAWMRLALNAPIIPSFRGDYHNHQPDFERGEKCKFVATLKMRALEERDRTIPDIFANESVRNREAAVRVSRSKTVRTMARSRKTVYPRPPVTVEDMRASILDPRFASLRQTRTGGDEFYVREVGGGTIGFASRRLIQAMRDRGQANHLFMDGTFKVVPNSPYGLRQLFSIHLLYMNVVFPIAYFLMTSRTIEAYREVLGYVREHLITWEVDFITTDFEAGVIDVVRELFGGARHHGCWFHYCQAIWRKVLRVAGLAQLCRQNPIIMKIIKMIMALPHLPAQRGPPNSLEIPPFSIADGLDAISNHVNEAGMDMRLNMFIEYVRRYWLGTVGADSLSNFGMARRTNNDLEGFHSRLLANFGAHPNIWMFVTRLQDLENEHFNDFSRANDHGIAVRRARQELVTEMVVRNMHELLLRRTTLIHFLSAVAHLANGLMVVLDRPRQDGEEEADDLGEMMAQGVAANEEVDAPPAALPPAPVVVIPAPDAVPPAPAAIEPAARGGPIRRVGRGRGRGLRRGRQGRGRRGGGRDEILIPPQEDANAGRLVRLCVICLENPSTFMSLPCMHLCMCYVCAMEYPQHQLLVPRCPLCNLACERYTRVYF